MPGLNNRLALTFPPRLACLTTCCDHKDKKLHPLAAGHYRAFVSGYSERNKKKFHVFDDNVQAVVATDSDVHTLCRNCYLLFFVQLTSQS